MPINPHKPTVENLDREWNVLIDDKHYQVKLQEVTKCPPGYMHYTVLKLIIIGESPEEFSIELDQSDNIFEFCDRKFLLRKGKIENSHDLYMDGKLIY